MTNNIINQMNLHKSIADLYQQVLTNQSLISNYTTMSQGAAVFKDIFEQNIKNCNSSITEIYKEIEVLKNNITSLPNDVANDLLIQSQLN